MAWQDEIALKRQEAEAAKASRNLHRESLSAVSDSGRGVVQATKELGATTSTLAKSKDISSLIEEVRELQLSALINNSKPTVILTDQTDLGDKLAAMVNDMAQTVKGLDSSETNKQQLTELKTLYTGLTQLKSVFTSGNKDLSTGIDKLTKAVNGLLMNPVVNVPAPQVKVDAPKIDLKPLQDTLKGYFEAPKVEKIDLECYRAQDITETDSKQYVGFVNPDGDWYIIENDIPGNSLRYVFGTGNYATAFQKAPQYEYQLLNEAINAV